MRDVDLPSGQRVHGRTWTAALLSVGLLTFGCGPAASTKTSENKPAATVDQEAESRTQRNLQSALASLQPDKLGLASSPEQSIAVLNEWAKGAKRAAEKQGSGWEPTQPHALLKSLPRDWIDQVTLEQFVERDAAFLRDCLWASKAARFGAGDAESDLDVVVNLFEYVIRNIDLIADADRRLPLGPFDVIVLGRGTAQERAWVFAELLRQRSIDAVLLSPQRPSDAAEDGAHLLIGVLFEKDILLFDPTLGMPLPADVTAPKSAMARLPMTLRQATRDPKLLDAIATDSGGQFALTAEQLSNAQVQLICHSDQLSSRMRHLQQELVGEQSIIVSDPLEDLPDQPGLWSRVARHPAATWSADDVAIWSFPQAMRKATSQLTPEHGQELAKLTASLGAPMRITQIKGDEVGRNMELQFSKPERALMKLRMQHIIGQWPEAVQGYLAVQLYDVDPPTSKELARVGSDGKVLGQISVVSNLEKQNLRLMMMQDVHKNVRRLHLMAGDDACFWLAQCQYEQKRLRAVVDQCRMYANQHSSGKWVAANQSLMAAALAQQNKLKEAVKVLKELDESAPSSGGGRVWIARWQRLLDAAE